MKITIDLSRDLSYSAKAALSAEAKEILSDKTMARDLISQILSGKQSIVALNGKRFTKRKPKDEQISSRPQTLFAKMLGRFQAICKRR